MLFTNKHGIWRRGRTRVFNMLFGGFLDEEDLVPFFGAIWKYKVRSVGQRNPQNSEIKGEHK